MGNVNGRKDEAEASGTKKNIKEEEEEEEYMEYYGHGGGGGGYDQVQARLPETLMVHHSPPSHSRSRSYHLQSPFFFSTQKKDMNNTTGNGIATLITWNYGGNQVAIEGSWDNWRTRELLKKTGKEIFRHIIKVLPPGVYHYRFVADGHYRYDPNLPHEGDGRGNVFNVLDLQEQDQEAEIMVENIEMNEEETAGAGAGAGGSSPLSSYQSNPFSLEDLNEKLPEIPPLLQKTPLEYLERSSELTLKKPLHAILNHLYIQTGTHTDDQSTVALASTHRFRRKFVTTVLYKSSNYPKK